MSIFIGSTTIVVPYLWGYAEQVPSQYVSEASVPGWPKRVVSRNQAYWAAQYDEAQEAHPAKGRF